MAMALKDGERTIAVLSDNLRWKSDDARLEESLNEFTQSALVGQLHPASGDPLGYIASECKSMLGTDAEVVDLDPPSEAEKRERANRLY